MILTLPYPPSNNRYYRNTRSGTLLSADGRSYRKTVADLVMLSRAKMVFGSLRVAIEVFPPTRWGIDLDNVSKGPLDALQHAGVYENDRQVEELHVIRRAAVAKPAKPYILVAIDAISRPA